MSHRQTSYINHLHLLRKVVAQEFNLELPLLQQLPMFNIENLELIITFYHLKFAKVFSKLPATSIFF